jgi:hypothetical protein
MFDPAESSMSPKLFPWLLLAIILLAGCKTTTSTPEKSKAVAQTGSPATVGSFGTASAIGIQSISAEAQPTATPTSTSNLGVKMVEIKNNWNGYSDITPILRHYKFLPKGDGLEGNGSFAVGGHGGYGIQQQYTKKIAIDPTLTQKFLQTLSATKITKSDRYSPRRDHRDDYPDITIHIKTADREVTFATRSQGPQNIPWQVRIKTKGKVESFVTNSANPSQALMSIKAQIDHPGLEQAIAKHNKPKTKTSPKPSQVVVNPSASPSASPK